MGISVNKPAPRWLRIASGIIGDGEDLFLAIWLITGHAADAPTMVIYKISSSFLRRQLKRFVSNGEVYAQEDTKTQSVTITETSVDTTLPYSAPNDNELRK